MELISLKSKDLFCFEDINIDFTKFKSGIVLIEGINNDDPDKSNGTGKSYCFEIINYVLFDNIIKDGILKGKDKIIRDGQKEGWAELIFKESNDIIKINKLRKKDKTLINIFINDIDQNIKGCTNGKIFIENMLGIDFETWQNSIISGQNKNSIFLSGSSKEKSDLIGEILNFSILDRCLKTIREQYIKDYNYKELTIKANLNSQVNLAKENDIPGQQDKLKSIKVNVLTTTTTLHCQENKLKDIIITDQKVKEKNRITKQIEDSKNRILQEFDIYESKKIEIKNNIENCDKELELLAELLKRAEKELAVKEQIEKLKIQRQELVQTKNELNYKITFFKEDSLKLNTKMNQLNKPGYTCSECGQNISESCLGTYAKRLKDNSVILDNLTIKLNTIVDSIQVIDTQGKELVANIDKDLNNKINKCKESKIHKEQLIKSQYSESKNYEKLTKSLQKYIEELDYQNKQIVIDKQIDAVEILNLKNNIFELEKQIKINQEEISTIESRLKIIEFCNIKIRNLTAELEALNIDFEKIKQADNIFGPDGIRNFLIEKFSPFIEKKLTDYLIKIDKGNIEFKLTFDPKFDITILVDGKPRDINLFSGGEKRLFSLIFNSVLTDIVVCSGKSFNFRVFDEATDNLDTANKTLSIEFLRQIALENKEQIYVITHDDYVKSIIENCCSGKIIVTKKNNISTAKNKE